MLAAAGGAVAGSRAMTAADIAALAERFRRFAEHESAEISPLYAALARAVAADRDLLALAAHIRAGQPPANMLFAAVHLLLREHAADDPLAAFYPDMTERAAPPEEAGPAFRAFCRRHAGAIRPLLETRSVSTNEAARASVLLPAFGLAAARADATPLHLIEVGPSAGLLLLWDRFVYRYAMGEGARHTLGDADAPLTLDCAVCGAPPPLPRRLPAVASRVGVDVSPLDPADPADAAWLRALVWPEQKWRLERLDRALALARTAPPPLVTGDALDLLPGLLEDLPADGLACVYHAFAVNQFSEAAEAAFDRVLRDAARARPIVRIGMEWHHPGGAELRWTWYGDAPAAETMLARCDPHGAWIAWQAEPSAAP